MFRLTAYIRKRGHALLVVLPVVHAPRLHRSGVELAKTPESGAMELVGNSLALALLMLHGALAMGTRMRALSVAGMLHVIRQLIEAMRRDGSTARLLV